MTWATFLDDYRVDPRLRNDLGLLFLVNPTRHNQRAVRPLCGTFHTATPGTG
jgi:hypothetical protein